MLSLLSDFRSALARNLFDGPAETPGARIYFRAFEIFLVAYTAYFCWDWGLYIHAQITSVLLPLGVAEYISISFMFEPYVALVNAGLVTVFGALGFFRVWRPAYLTVLALFHLQYVSRYCLGEISHGSNLIGMGILGLGIAMVAFQNENRRRRFSFGFLYFFIGLGYTSAAVCKLVATGPSWIDGRHLLLWIGERQVDTISKFGAFDPTILQEWVMADYRFGTLFLLIGLVTEAASILVWWRKARYPVVLMILGMHIGIVFTMNIFFHASTYLLIVLGIPWHRVIDSIRSISFSSSPVRRRAA